MARKREDIDLEAVDDKETVAASIEALNALLRKNWKGTAVKSYEDIVANTSTLSSGSLNIDMLLKYPFPAGIHEIAGGMGAGKSTLALFLCANAQKKGWPTYYVNLERTINKLFLDRIKTLDKQKLTILDPETSDDATEMALTIFRQVNNAVVIYDSIPASLATEGVMAKSMNEQSMGTVAKLMSTFLAKACPLVSDSGGRLILLNQIRDNLSPYGGGRVTPGGKAVKHWPTSRLFLSGEEVKANLIREGDNGKPLGKKVEVEVVKNRWSLPGEKSELIISFDNGIWQEMEVLKIAVSLGVITRNGAWYYNDKEERFAQGELNALNVLTSDKDFMDRVVNKIKEMTGLSNEIV